MDNFQLRKKKKKKTTKNQKSTEKIQPIPGVNPVPAGKEICFPCCSWRVIELDVLILGKAVEQEENQLQESGGCFEVKGKRTFLGLSG